MIRETRTSRTGAPRRGITILETLVLVTCIAIVLGLVAVTIGVALRLVADGQSRVSSSLALERLAQQLRDDAHSSATALLEGGAGGPSPAARATLKFAPESGRVVAYKVFDKSVDRDETLAGKRVRHESFVLPRGREARFTIGAEAGREMVSLYLEPGPASGSGGSPRVLEVLAVVGKHRGGPIDKREVPKR